MLFSEIEKCLRRTAVYKESVIFYGFNLSPAFCVPISESKERGGPFNILLSGEAESWIFLWLNTFDYLKVVAQNYGCDSLVLSLHLVIYSVINDFTSEIKNNSSFPKTMNGDCLLAIWTNKTLKTCKQCTLG